MKGRLEIFTEYYQAISTNYGNNFKNFGFIFSFKDRIHQKLKCINI